LAERVGPWCSPDKAYATPSQEWLFRAWYSGATLRFLASVTVIVVLAGPRPGSYARRISPDHELIAQWLKEDPKCRERILEEAAVNEAMGIDIHHCGRSDGCCFVRFIFFSRRWEFIRFPCRSQWFLGAGAAWSETIAELPVLSRGASATRRANSIRRQAS
jgi:hypothetical protein